MTAPRSPGARRRAPVAALVPFLALLAACDGAAEEPAPPRTPRGEEPAASPSDADVARSVDELRALGYIGFTDEVVEEGEEPVRVRDPERCAPGYTLVSTSELALAELYDLEGDVVHRWEGRPGDVWSNVEMLANGDVLVPARRSGRTLLRIAWDGTELWAADVRAHHDADPLPSGEIATLTFRHRELPAISEADPVKDHSIVLLSEDGEVVDRASIYDMLAAAPELFRFQPVSRKAGRSRDIVDLLHCNSVEFMRHEELFGTDPLYAPHHVLVSIRHQDTIAVFDWREKRLVWAWGQGELSGPHDANLLPNGHVLVFDNGISRSWSRVVELDPLTKEIVWQYLAPEPTDFFTLRAGSNQRLPNGNTLFAESDRGQAFEVTRDGEIVWHFVNPHGDGQGHRATIVRVKRYPEARVHELLGLGRPPRR